MSSENMFCVHVKLRYMKMSNNRVVWKILPKQLH